MNESYIHRLNVVTKLFLFLCIIVAVFLFNHPLPNLVLAVVLLAFVLPARLNLKGMFATLNGLRVIIILIVAMSMFTAQASAFKNESSKQVLFVLWKWPATLGGLYQGLTFTLRIFIMVLATCTFTITTPIDDLLSFLNRVHAPYELSIVVATAISFVPTLMNKKDMIFQAQRARGAGINDKGGIRQLIAYIPIMVPLVTNSILMADNLSISMTNRGYGANKSWTDMIDKHAEAKDYIVMFFGLVFTAGLFVVRYVFNVGAI